MMRGILAIGLTAMLIAVGVACSSEDSADPTTTTAAAKDDEATTTTAPAMSDEDFEGVAEDFSGQVDAAGGDFCQLMEASSFAPESAPSNTDQVKAAVEQVTGYFRALAGAEGVDSTTAASLTSLADDLQRAAEDSGYSVEFMNSQQTTDMFQRQEYIDAMGVLLSKSEKECGGTPTTTAG
jgi:hypothetical protein